MNYEIMYFFKDYLKNVGIRMIRMVPPWSVGTIGNREMRVSRTYVRRLQDRIRCSKKGG